MPDPHMHAGPITIPGGSALPDEIEAKIGLGIDLRLGHAVTALERVADWLGRTTALPRYASFAGQAAADASGNALIQLGPVPQGLRWVVHGVRAGGIMWGTAAAGTAIFAVLPSAPSADVGLPTIAVRWASSALPQSEKFSRGELVAMSMESLWVLVTGGTSGQVYAASASMVVEPMAS